MPSYCSCAECAWEIVYNDPTVCVCVCVCVCHFSPHKKNQTNWAVEITVEADILLSNTVKPVGGSTYHDTTAALWYVHVYMFGVGVLPSIHALIHASIHPLQLILSHLPNNILLLLLGDPKSLPNQMRHLISTCSESTLGFPPPQTCLKNLQSKLLYSLLPPDV